MTLQGINMKNYGVGSTEFNERNDLNSHNGLLKEYKKLVIQLKQLQILEKRTNGQLKALLNEENQCVEEIQRFSAYQTLRTEATTKMEELMTRLEEIKNKKRVTENVVEEAMKTNKEIKDHLRSNETYRQLSHLEDKLTDLIKENKILQESVEQSQMVSKISRR